MQGSERQIEWAENILAGWEREFETIINEARTRVENESMPQRWLDVNINGIDNVKNTLRSKDAKTIINLSQKKNVINMVKQAILVDYNKQ